MKTTHEIMTGRSRRFRELAWFGALVLTFTLAGNAAGQDMAAFRGVGHTVTKPFTLARSDDDTEPHEGPDTSVGNLFATGARMINGELNSATYIAISEQALFNVLDAEAGIELKNVPVGAGRHTSAR